MDNSNSLATTHILHLEDSIADHRLVCRKLDSGELRYSISRVDSIEAFLSHVMSGTVDVILADYRLAGFTAIDAWTAMQAAIDRPPFILLSGAIGESAAVAAIHLGISDYLHKDDLSRLDRVIQRALEVHNTRKAHDKAALELAASEERLSAFTGHLQEAIERERAAISREIHDDIGGALAAVKLDLAWLSRHSTEPAIQAHINSGMELLQHALGASQRIMMNLRPPILDQGLVAAVQWLATSFEKRTGIRTVLRANTEILSPPKDVQLAAYRTAQEALTNISKYAQCKSVSIDISDGEGVLTLEISDDGVGMSDLELKRPNAFGIRGLYERAKTVGGWLDVSSKKGLGTSIILSVPLLAEQQSSCEENFH